MTLEILKDLEKQLTDYEELILTAPKRHIQDKDLAKQFNKTITDIRHERKQYSLLLSQLIIYGRRGHQFKNRTTIRRQKYAAAKRLERKDYTAEEIAETLNIKIEEVEEYLYRRV